MNYKEIFDSLEERAKKQLDFMNSLSNEEKEKIIKEEQEISERIKLMLDEVNLAVSDIQTVFRKDFKSKDGKVFNAFYTVFTSTETQRAISVVTDFKTKKILYVKVSVNKFISVKDFFNLTE